MHSCRCGSRRGQATQPFDQMCELLANGSVNDPNLCVVSRLNVTTEFSSERIEAARLCLLLSGYRRGTRFSESGEDRTDHVPMYVGEALFSPAEPVRETLMIQPEQVKNRCVEIVNSNWIRRYLVT